MADEAEAMNDILPRNYQVELMKIALKQNTVIFLPTGSGKTYIAILVMKQMSSDILRPWSKGGKVSVILVNTVALVYQHCKYLERHTTFKVGSYLGDKNVDFWDRETWERECNEHNVLVMTSQILTDAVEKSFISLERVNLLIFDECHRAVNGHTMRQLMKNFQHVIDQPRVLGLTATLLNGNYKPQQVMKQVQMLETTYHGQVATVDELDEVTGYSTNPHETVQSYQEYNLTKTEETVVNMLTKLKDMVALIKLEKNINPKKPNLTPLAQKSDISLLCNLIDDLIFHITELGTFGGIKAIIAHSIQVERLKKNCSEKMFYLILNSVLTEFMLGKNILEKQLSGNAQMDIFRYSSPKVNMLLEIVKNYKKKSKEELCAIIFTQRKFTAKILHYIIKSLAENFPEYSYIQSNFLVGSSSNPFSDTREALYVSKINKNIIQKFYHKEINLLNSTNILEEGIDIPKCSLVVKFDAPLDYRSYIQSKGRARHKNSLYYILVGQADYLKYMDKYEMFKHIEDNLIEYLVGRNEHRSLPTFTDLTKLYDEHKIPPYYVEGPNSAHVNMASACSLLSQYCSSLQSDNYTSYTPNWYLEKTEGNPEHSFRVVIDLPTVCPILDSIEGPYMRTKKDAKRAAALKACILLHKVGALDNNLKPVKYCGIEENYNYLYSHWPTEKESNAGNNKKRRVHSVYVPTVIKGCFITEQFVHLHLINLTPKFEASKLTNSWSFMHDLYTSLLCFGIITQNKLPDLCEFPVFVGAGEITVSIETNISTTSLSSEEFKEIQEFNHLIYNDILQILKEYLLFNNFDDEGVPMLLLVPIQKDERRIDFSIISQNKCLINKCLEPSSEEKMRICVSQEEYLGKIVTPWYRQDETDYLVTQVCTDLNAHSNFPSSTHRSYFHYFSSMYQIRILNPNQPLLKVKALSPRLNCLKPRGTLGKHSKDLMYEDYEIHFVPEMVVKQNFPSQLWVQAKLIPSIFDKLLQLLRVYELRQIIAFEADLGVSTPSHKWESLKLDVHLLNWSAEFKDKIEKSFKEADDIVEQLKMEDITSIVHKLNTEVAMKKLNTEFPWDVSEEPIDIERNLNVTLMDIQYYENFLNKRVSTEERIIYNTSNSSSIPAITYHKNFIEKNIAVLDKNCFVGPELAEIYKAFATAKCGDIVNLERLETLGDSFLKFVSSLFIFLRYPKADEGTATTLKGKLVSNRNLYYIALKKGLEQYVKLNELKPKSEWSPPGYCLPKVLKFLAENGQVNNSTLLNVEIPSVEQVTGELSIETEHSILLQATSAEVYSNECDASLIYFIGKQVISDKVVADVVESLLGIYLESCGIEAGIKLTEWLEIIPKSENLLQLLHSAPPNPKLNPNATQENIDYHIPTHKDLEERLGYKFRNRGFLLQALTHSSFVPNRVTACYQRLEFLGDAVLDFLITCYIYESCGNLNPGDLTDLRSALVNNITFACYTVRCGFHKFLLAINSKLQNYIDRFLIFQENKDFIVNDDVLILLNEDDMHIAENIDVPKVLGDIFEALAGAVFLDSGMDLKTVWKVFYKIMWKEIELFSNKVPKNAVRVLHEKHGVHPQFHDPVFLDNGKVMIKLDFMIEGSLKRVHGFGDNKNVAKKAAAKLALRLLDRI